MRVLSDRNSATVVVTVVETDRSVPRHTGSKMLVFADRRQMLRAAAAFGPVVHAPPAP